MQDALRVPATGLAILLVTLCCGCSGGSAGSAAADLSHSTPPVSPPASPGSFARRVPAPADLARLLEPRQTSNFTEEDLIKNGSHFDPALPNQNVASAGNSVEFAAGWSAPDDLAPANLAFCTYSFTIIGYDRAPEVRYGWETAPAEIATTWLGLANWDTDSWDWHPGNDLGLQTFTTFDPYINDADVLLAIILQANADTSRLRWIRLGPHVLSAALETVPHTGLAPLNLTLDASDSSTAVGTLDLFEWDFDGDGTFDADSGATTTTSHEYTEAGELTPRVRVTSSYGIQATAETTIMLPGPWAHSWGGEANDQIEAVFYDGQDSLYAVGQTSSFGAGGRDLLLLKLDMLGNLVWARAWGGELDDAGNDVVPAGDGNIFTVGYTSNFGAGLPDVLAQKWTPDGDLLWSTTWGESKEEMGMGASQSAGNLFIAGFTSSFHSSLDVLLLRVSASGEVEWASYWGDNSLNELGADIVCTYNTLADMTFLHIAGNTIPGTGGDLLYLLFNEDQEGLEKRYWIADGKQSAGTILATLDEEQNPVVYIAGTHEVAPANTDALLLEVAGDGEPHLARIWGGERSESVTGLLPGRNGGFALSGDSSSFSESTRGYVLGISSSGGLDAAHAWSDSLVHGSSMFPGGMLLGGEAQSAEGGTWTPVSGTIDTPAGTWSDLFFTYGPVTGITASPTGTVTNVTDGVTDTGGGGGDGLLLLRTLP